MNPEAIARQQIARLERETTRDDARTLSGLTGGKTLGQISATLLRAIDPDVIAERATGKPGPPPQEVEPALFEKVAAQESDCADSVCTI